MSSSSSSYENIASSDAGSGEESNQQLVVQTTTVDEASWEVKAKRLESDLSILKAEFVEEVKHNSLLISTITLLRLQLISVHHEMKKLEEVGVKLDEQIQKNTELEAQNSNYQEQIEELKKTNGELQFEVTDLKKEKWQLSVKVNNLENKPTRFFKSKIMREVGGIWKIVRSMDVEEYVKRWNTDPLSDALFQVGQPSIIYHNDDLTMSERLGNREYNLVHSRYGYWVCVDGIMMKSMVEDDKFVTVYKFESHKENGGEEFARTERRVIGGELHIVQKRFGTSCTRIYERIEEPVDESYSSKKDYNGPFLRPVWRNREQNIKPEITPSMDWLGVYEISKEYIGSTTLLAFDITKIEFGMVYCCKITLKVLTDDGWREIHDFEWITDNLLIMGGRTKICWCKGSLVIWLDGKPVYFVKEQKSE